MVRAPRPGWGRVCLGAVIEPVQVCPCRGRGCTRVEWPVGARTLPPAWHLVPGTLRCPQLGWCWGFHRCGRAAQLPHPPCVETPALLGLGVLWAGAAPAFVRLPPSPPPPVGLGFVPRESRSPCSAVCSFSYLCGPSPGGSPGKPSWGGGLRQHPPCCLHLLPASCEKCLRQRGPVLRGWGPLEGSLGRGVTPPQLLGRGACGSPERVGPLTGVQWTG